jgi:S-adenosylmethionine:tRNA ribosyltransferase-isomerase
MRASDLDYNLPPELIAQQPLPERDASRLLLVDVDAARLEDHRFVELPALLPPSLFVLNDTRVFPARLFGTKGTGGKVELLLLHKVAGRSDRWLALVRSSKAVRPGMELWLCDGRLRGQVVRTADRGQLEIDLEGAESVDTVIEQLGQVPLPPYIRREAEVADRERYQTIYARKSGAVAAPTAGLHFSERVLRELQSAGHELAYVTLHVGPGTFRPVQAETLDEHVMHAEVYEVPEVTARAVAQARAHGRSIVAVGTTVVRALESSTDSTGNLVPGAGATDLFIRPPYRFRMVDHLVTNFHLPRSTLLALVMAFAGVELTKRAYREAIERRYRFYSYGDAMLIRRATR